MSDEHGEKFYQNIKAKEKRYEGFENEGIMGDIVGRCTLMIQLIHASGTHIASILRFHLTSL